MALRETGSILVHAPRERVHEVICERLAHEHGVHVTPDRLDSKRATFVLQDAPGGTRVVCARTAPQLAGRDDLRRAVADELLALQKLV